MLSFSSLLCNTCLSSSLSYFSVLRLNIVAYVVKQSSLISLIRVIQRLLLTLFMTTKPVSSLPWHAAIFRSDFLRFHSLVREHISSYLPIFLYLSLPSILYYPSLFQTMILPSIDHNRPYSDNLHIMLL